MKNFKNIDLSSISVNGSQIRMLFNANPGMIKSLMGGRRSIPISEVSKIIKSTTRSFDPRYDNLDVVQLTVQTIRAKGLPISIATKALNSKACIKKKSLTGVFDVFNQILNESDLEAIRKNLEYKHAYTRKYKC